MRFCKSSICRPLPAAITDDNRTQNSCVERLWYCIEVKVCKSIGRLVQRIHDASGTRVISYQLITANFVEVSSFVSLQRLILDQHMHYLPQLHHIPFYQHVKRWKEDERCVCVSLYLYLYPQDVDVEVED